MDASLRLLRVIQIAFLVSVAFYVAIPEKVGPHEVRDVKQLQIVLGLLAGSLVVTILFFRQRLLGPAEDVLRTQPEEGVALRRWRTANLATLVCAEAVVLYGMVLRFLGGTLPQAAPFYAAGVLLMFIFTPRRPE
jgi:4-amino-4-deoxy-L-arabinose transferase-like glycosyltransferase